MKDATFLVTAADDESAVLRDVTDSQVHTLSTNPGVEVGEIVAASIEPEPPMEVAWQVVEITDQRTIPVERSPEPPTKQAREIAADQPVGEITRQERAGEGELHVITVPDGEADDAAADVLDDEETLARAARLGVDRVEVRADGQALSVRYLP
ncbi:DUF5812 family protein [Halorientalis regularis]|jgi:hypothetical protein|uniref:Uncharacterized protein n=1 Tax=Halorientalis regularis TaxID=660518 RepID=A0A1G7L9U5_9EURY|nr:DUF5812 family protein [Halorientalis regularis]SDF46151.1 hypothetical protein SAMN05216218_106213 [Halorientalis regularis]